MLFSVAPLWGFMGLDLPKASALETSGDCGDGGKWSFNQCTGTLTISGSGEMGADDNDVWRSLNISNIIIEKGITKTG